MVAELPLSEALDPARSVLTTIDGLVAAAAMIAETSGLVRSQRDRRELADEMRTAMLKSMKSARDEIGDALPALMGATH